jgi:murein DD-endopeptidase MepM/ murein hydrolase activator NlpD
MTILKNFIKPFVKFIIISLLLVPFITLNQANALTKREELKATLTGIQGEIQNSLSQIESLGGVKKDLAQQISSVQGEIIKIEDLIKRTDETLQKVNLQIPITESKIKDTEDRIYKVYKEIQYLSTTSKFEQIVTSESFSDLMANLYGLSGAQEELDKLEKQFNSQLSELKEQKKIQEELKKAQEESKYLLNGKKSSLERLLQDTQNKQEEYEKKLGEQKQASERAQTEINSLPDDIKTYIFNNGGNPSGSGSYNGPCYFEDSRPLSYPAGYFAQPTNGVWSDNFSCYPWSFGWRQNGHDGLDISNAYGTPVVSTAPGVVRQVWTVANSGANGLSIKHTLPNGQVVYSVYWHLDKVPVVMQGQTVERNQFIGEMGSTGYSTGPHLHFMIVSDTYEQYNIGCSYGNRRAKCYNPAPLIGW